MDTFFFKNFLCIRCIDLKYFFQTTLYQQYIHKSLQKFTKMIEQCSSKSGKNDARARSIICKVHARIDRAFVKFDRGGSSMIEHTLQML